MSGVDGRIGEKVSLLGISGSLRHGSSNTGLLRAAGEQLAEDVELTIFDLKEVPLFDADVEAVGDPEAVTALEEAVRRSDGVLFASPEYNSGVTGVLKNAIDWASRDRGDGALAGKPVAMVGPGGWDGTARSQSQLQAVLSGAGALVMVQPGVLVSMAWEKFDENGNLLDDETRGFLRAHLEALVEWIGRVGTRTEAPLAA